MHINSTLWVSVSPQWLSELRQLWLSVPWLVVCELISLLGFHTVPRQHSPLLLWWIKMYACSGVMCHLHFWQNDWGLLLAIVGTQGWNVHQRKVSTKSELWRKKSSTSSARIWTHNLLVMSLSLYQLSCPVTLTLKDGSLQALPSSVKPFNCHEPLNCLIPLNCLEEHYQNCCHHSARNYFGHLFK